MTRNVWAEIASCLPLVERPSRYLDHERGARRDEHADYRCALVYPDVYEIGQSNLGLAILYHALNDAEHLSCERAYLPWVDLIDLMRERDIPLFALESYDALYEFDLVGFTMPYELAITNVLEALDLARIPLLAADRTDDDPLVIAGGPCTYNPEPFCDFFDVFLIGEGEGEIVEFAREHRRLRDAGATRQEMLRALACVEGAYVPSLYEQAAGDGLTEGETTDDGRPPLAGPLMRPTHPNAPAIVYKRVVRDFDAMPIHVQQIVPYAEATHDRYSVEVMRGCSRGCRFCQAGMIYRPVRERSADTVVSATMRGLACTGYDEVSLTSLSTTDHSQIKEILRRLNARLEGTGVRVSVPSQRVDAFGVEMARLVAGNKKGGLTFAPEAGTQRLRDCINKNVTEDDLLETIAAAMQAGWRRVKLYFMCGLPTETDEDVRGIGELVGRALEVARANVPKQDRGSVRMSVACAVFVPKPDTPFQWCGQIAPEEVQRRIDIIRSSLPRKGVDFHWHEPATSYVEAAVSRGGRALGAAILAAWRAGARFDAWNEQFNWAAWVQGAREAGIDLQEAATRTFSFSDPLPWAHISCGVSQAYLARELERARVGVTTPDCTFTSCTGCGICQTLDCRVMLGGERHE
jgi:radical SAM family uncharacterized protein